MHAKKSGFLDLKKSRRAGLSAMLVAHREGAQRVAWKRVHQPDDRPVGGDEDGLAVGGEL